MKKKNRKNIVIAAVTIVAVTIIALIVARASATPNASFTYTLTGNQVSLVANPTCYMAPCSYTWYINDIKVGGQRSFVTTLAPGCSSVRLLKQERTYRNYTNPRAETTQTICVN
ncbi:MAG TPA: hypothetical protein VF272_00295 [Candidatus Saccharimonadia bacterium]